MAKFERENVGQCYELRSAVKLSWALQQAAKGSIGSIEVRQDQYSMLKRESEGVVPQRRPTLQSTSPVMLAIEGIDAMLASGKLIPGQRLAESDLSDELGVPRGRVREALRILAGRGVVELAAYKSARVRRLSMEEVSSLFEMITGLFCTGLVLLALRYSQLGAEERSEFDAKSVALTLQAERGSLAELIASLLTYHQLVNRLCGNHHLESVMSGLHLAHYYKAIADILAEPHLRRALGFASKISKAVGSGKPDLTMAMLWEAVQPLVSRLDPDIAKAHGRSRPAASHSSKTPKAKTSKRRA